MEFMEGEGAAVGTAAAFRGLGWRRHRGGGSAGEWMRTAPPRRGGDGVLMTSHDDVDRCGWREFP